MIEVISGILEGTLLYALNPLTWAIVILLSIWTKTYWKPVVAGVLAQITCSFLFILFAVKFLEISTDELYGDASVTDIVAFFSVSVLSGMMISALVILFIRERRLHKLTVS